MRLVRRARLVHSVALAVALLLGGTAGQAESAVALRGTVTDLTAAPLAGVTVGTVCGSALTNATAQYSLTEEQLCSARRHRDFPAHRLLPAQRAVLHHGDAHDG